MTQATEGHTKTDHWTRLKGTEFIVKNLTKKTLCPDAFAVNSTEVKNNENS